MYTTKFSTCIPVLYSCTILYLLYVLNCTGMSKAVHVYDTCTEFLKSEYRTAILNLVPVGGRVYEQYSFTSVNVSRSLANFSKTEFCCFQFHIRDDQDSKFSINITMTVRP
jgi:hypothetical protein